MRFELGLLSVAVLLLSADTVLSQHGPAKDQLEPFNDRVLPPNQRNGQEIEQLGRIIKLNTLFAPKKIRQFSTKFGIYTRRKANPALPFLGKTGSIKNKYQFELHKLAISDFNPKLPTVILVPGYLSNEFEPWMEEAKNLWLELDDVNVITVNWDYHNRYTYSTAVADCPLVARQVTIFLYYLAELNDIRVTDETFLANVHIIGHSLGAHIAGFVGQDLNGRLGRITGLDPAGPSFDNMSRDLRLDPTDAELVVAIHTNSGKLHYANLVASSLLRASEMAMDWAPVLNRAVSCLSSGYTREGDTAWYGIDTQVGHLDYYANNGRIQPNCKGLLHVCDHSRSIEIFLDVLKYEQLLRSFSPQLATQNRLLAFAAAGFEEFQGSKNFERNCPSLVAKGESEIEPIDPETLAKCSIPIDLVSSARGLRRELSTSYRIDLSTPEPSQGKYYFMTASERPFVSDHYLLWLRLKSTPKWNNGCGLEIVLSIWGTTQIFINLNKQINLVAGDLIVPFAHPKGAAATMALRNLYSSLKPNQTGIHSNQSQELGKILPYKVDLMVTNAKSTGVLEAAKKKMRSFFTLGADPKTYIVCKLEIGAIEIQPIISSSLKMRALYSTRNDPLPPKLVQSKKLIDLHYSEMPGLVLERKVRTTKYIDSVIIT